MKSVSARLERLEHRPQGAIPRFVIEYTDGRKEHFTGADIISHYEGVRHVYFDPQHQASVDTAALYALLHDGIEVIPKGDSA